MMLYYRADLFTKYGLDRAEDLGRVRRRPPAPCAQKDHEASTWPRSPPTTPAGSPAWPSRPAPSGGDQRRDLEGRHQRRRHQEGRRLLGRPGREGAVDDQPMYTPEWNKALNDGTLLAWPSAVWAPGRAGRQRARHQGQVGDGAAAAVDRRARTTPATGAARPPRSPSSSKQQGRRRAVRDLAEHRPEAPRTCSSRRAASTRPPRKGGQALLSEPPAFFSNQTDF